MTSWFSDDDLMNLHYYWSRPWTLLLKANVLFFSGEPRALGAVYYCGIYWIWGMNPLPYRVGALILVCLNLVILFLLVQELCGSTEAAAVALLLTGLNESFVSLYYDTGMIYDVLAFFCYYGALYYYLRLRRSGRLLTLRQIFVFAALNVLALNSKEISVSLPVALFLYEVLWHPPAGFRRWRSWKEWIAGPARVTWVSGALTLAYLVGLVVGPSNWKNAVSFRPDVSVSIYLERTAWYLRLLSLDVLKPLPTGALMILIGSFVVGCLLWKKHLVFASLMAIISILPLAFIPIRGGFAFCVPSLYRSLWVAGVLVAVREQLIPLERVPDPERLAVQLVLPLVLAAYLVPLNAKAFDQVLPITQTTQDRNRRYAEEIHRSLPRIPRGARVLILNDPWKDLPFQAGFLVDLSYGDPTMTAVTARAMKLYGGDYDPKKYDLLLDFANDHFQPPAIH